MGMLQEDGTLKRSEWMILSVLRGPEVDFTGREVARRAGLSHQQAHVILRRLLKRGLVERRIFPPAYLYRLGKSLNPRENNSPDGKGGVTL